MVNSNYPTYDEIETHKFQYSPGQYFYAYDQNTFWQLSIDAAGTLTLTQQADGDWIAYTGRQALYFQYRHNSPLTSRLDPGSTNIIDLYVVTNQYYTAYQNYIRDVTGTVAEPTPPTINELTTEYQGLQDYKMISDTVILNSVEFKPLFGAKADESLRATIKVIQAFNSNASISEIKNSVVNALNNYFSIDNWDFGETFYFSELASYLHVQLMPNISSIVIVPANQAEAFGSLLQVNANINEIITSAATVDNVQIITAITAAQLNQTGTVIVA